MERFWKGLLLFLIAVGIGTVILLMVLAIFNIIVVPVLVRIAFIGVIIGGIILSK